MDLFSFILSVVGIAISGAAYAKARSVKKAVEDTIGHRNAQEDLVRVSGLIASLEAAKESVSPWVDGMPQDRRMGRNQNDDLARLSKTVDHLRTKAPIGIDASHSARVKKSASILDREFKEITFSTDNKDHWKAALSEIQLIIPRLEQVEREVRDRQLGK